jgi:thiol-disulfide isomerase/thioredoxin
MSRSALPLAYLGFGVIGAAVLGAYAYDRLHPTAAPAAPTALAQPAATAGPATTAAAAEGRVPARRPDFTLRDLTGAARTLSSFDGRPLIINFWATWCAPCRREIPLLNRLQREFGTKGPQVIGIAVDFADDVRAFAKKTPLDYPVLVGEEDGLEAARGFGVEAMAFPFTAFTDSAGHVLLVHMGELHEDQARAVLRVVADVDAGRRALPEARQAIEAALAALAPPAAGAEPLKIHAN